MIDDNLRSVCRSFAQFRKKCFFNHFLFDCVSEFGNYTFFVLKNRLDFDGDILIDGIGASFCPCLAVQAVINHSAFGFACESNSCSLFNFAGIDVCDRRLDPVNLFADQLIECETEIAFGVSGCVISGECGLVRIPFQINLSAFRFIP